MRFHNIFEGFLGTTGVVRILPVLLKYPTKRFSGREVARLSGLSPAVAWRALKMLELHGILMRIRVGNSDVWSVRPEHFLVTALTSACTLELQAFKRLKQIVFKHLQGVSVKNVYLFGSVARGDEKPNSDLDLLVVIENGGNKNKAISKLLGASMETASIFGNTMIPIVYTENEFKKKQDLPLVKNIKKDKLVLLER